ncbi:MBL fold metallo-hydrolase [Microbacterium caowuchunii]|uniref:MBL fold metallo-hydrolase n=1 Tax=Microbacterium caowuchunii TaxID=2614638 RepID=A0A5N0TDK1_9MICO|nr:MBL fold metallo-hydrolase [Microbacterium caowuchunii]KAA9132157.1 MBL fold metallo-hydrolase [Microbacterium caowuchunii]
MAQDNSRDAASRMEQIADRVWAYIQPDGGWMINNMGLIDGPDGATSIDVTSTEQRTRDYLRAVSGVTDSPVRRVVLTHSHPDHCNGASLLPDAEIIAHRTVAADLSRPHAMAGHIFDPYVQGDVQPRLPTIAFDESLTIAPGDRPIEVRHPGGAAHTTGDAFVWLPQERVLFTGDLVFHGGTPFVLSGSPAGWLRALDQMAALEPVTVVPGHGPVGGPELFEPVADYLRFLMDAAADAHARGLTAAEAARGLDLGRFAELAETERIVGNLHRVLAELDGGQPDFAAAWQGMYEYNGSRPLSCDA